MNPRWTVPALILLAAIVGLVARMERWGVALVGLAAGALIVAVESIPSARRRRRHRNQL